MDMDKEIKNYLGIIGIFGIVLAIVASFWYVSVYSRSIYPQRVFTVSGEGKALALPNLVELSFGVLTEGGKNIGVLQKQNTEKVNKIIAFLKENEIEEKDIKTQYYNIFPRYQHYSCPLPQSEIPAPCPPSEIVGYTINQSVLVKIRDLAKAGDVISGVVERGATNISGLNFIIDDSTELENQAREEAMKKAKNKAEAIAKTSGFKLGKLLTVQEGIISPQPFYRNYGFAEGKGGDVPIIEPGSQEIRVSITLTYQIK